MQSLRENTHKNQPQHKFLHWVGWSSPGPDDLAAQCLNFRSKSGWSHPGPDDPDLVTCERPEQPRSDDPALYRMIRTWEFLSVFLPENTQQSLSGWEYIYPFTPLHLLPSLSPRPTTPPKASNTSFLFILELNSCKETPRDWEKVRFEVWFESTLWASTYSSQEAFEATFDSSIHVCYSWSLTPRRLEVPVSFHSFVVEPRKFVLPVLCGHLLVSISILLSSWLSEERLIGQPCSLWAPQRRRSSFCGVNFGINLVSHSFIIVFIVLELILTWSTC